MSKINDEMLGIALEIVDPSALDDFPDDVGEDRTVDGYFIETYYCPLKTLSLTETHLRVVGDNDFTDVEIRIPLTELRKLLKKK